MSMELSTACSKETRPVIGNPKALIIQPCDNLHPLYKATLEPYLNVRALIIRIGFGSHYTIIITSPQNSIGKY